MTRRDPRGTRVRPFDSRGLGAEDGMTRHDYDRTLGSIAARAAVMPAAPLTELLDE